LIFNSLRINQERFTRSTAFPAQPLLPRRLRIFFMRKKSIAARQNRSGDKGGKRMN
jgi:hypothetical protein